MHRFSFVNPWFFALLFTFLFSLFSFYFFHLIHPGGTPFDLQTFLFAFFSGFVDLLAVYTSFRLIRYKQASMSFGTFYVLLFFISLFVFVLLYNFYWIVLTRKWIHGVDTDIEMIIHQNKGMIGITHVPIAVATILGLYNKKVFQLNQDVILKEKMLSEARLNQLQQQVDPHFLFNNLNILSALIRQSPGKAEIFTQRLSELYRNYLRFGNQSLASLKEELLFMQDYLYLLECRFGKAFPFVISNETSVKEEEVFLVVGTLQLLLENVVKHNTASEQDPLSVTLHIDADKLVMENEVRKREAASERVGLQNLAKRYGILTGKPISYTRENGIFRISIPLLKKMKPTT